MTEGHNVIVEVCKAVSGGNDTEARNLLLEKYPFVYTRKSGRVYTDKEKLGVFVRDGFIDRYSGSRLVFPPVLRLLSMKFPREFPFHPNWKMSECHLAYWELVPTVDHVVPVTRGGSDSPSNWVCTSQLRNNAKSNWLLEELGWQLKPPGNMRQWDGLLSWYVDHVGSNEGLMKDRYFGHWHKLSKQEMET